MAAIKARTAAGRLGVAAVGEKVDVRVRDGGRLRGVHERKEVVDVAVDAAIRDEAEEVNTASAGLGTVKGGRERRILGNVARLDGQVDANNVLVDNAAGAHIQMTHLAVAHEAVRQADRKAMRGHCHPLQRTPQQTDARGPGGAPPRSSQIPT